MIAAKRKGTAWESQICAYLRSQGWPNAERRALNGRLDRGDIAGIPGCVIEAKSCKTFDLAGWADELAAEIVNDQASTGAVVAKRRNRSVSHAYAIMSLEAYTRLLSGAGY